MSRIAHLPRRALVPAAAVLAVALTLAGCAAGQIAQTANQVAAIDGANGTVGQLGVRNALLATPGGTGYAKGADAPLQLWVSNTGITADTLTGVTTSAASSVQITGTASVPGNTLVDLTGTGVKLTLKSLTSDVTYGESIPVTFSFASAGEVTINVPVEIPAARTTGRPDVDIQPTEGSSLYENSEKTGTAAG